MSAPEQTLSGSVCRIVSRSDTAAAWGEDFPEAASTPFVLGLAELACHDAVRDSLAPGEVTVGISAEIEHLAPSRIGAVLTATATGERDGRRLTFTVSVRDGDREVATVRHRRAPVEAQKIIDLLREA